MSATYNGVEITFYLGQRSQDKHEVSILLPLNLVSGVVIAALFHVDSSTCSTYGEAYTAVSAAV